MIGGAGKRKENLLTNVPRGGEVNASLGGGKMDAIS